MSLILTNGVENWLAGGIWVALLVVVLAFHKGW